MKNSEDHIDKLFRDNLGNQSFDIPDDFIDSLNNQLDEIQPSQNRKGKILFYFLNSLFLIFFLATSFNSQSLEKEIAISELTNDSQSERTKNLIKKSENVASNPIIENQKDQITFENSDTLQSKTEEELKLEEVVNDMFTKSNNEIQTSLQKNKKDKITASKKEVETLDAEDKTQNNTLKPDDSKNLKREKNNSLDNNSSAKTNEKIENRSDVNSNSQRIEKQEELARESKNISIAKTENKNINEEDNFTDSTIISKTSENKISSDSTQTTTEDSISRVAEKAIKDSSSIAEKNKINQNNLAKLKIEAQVFGGFNYGGQYFSKNTQSGASFNVEKSPMFTPTFGFNINTTFKNISLGSGIEHFKTSEKIDLNTVEYFETDTIEIVGYMADSIIFDSVTQQWDTTYISIFDTVTYNDTINTSENWVNTYSWISVPLNVGYRFDFGKWAVIPKAGVTFNFGLRKSSGQYYNSSGENPGITTIKPVQFNIDYLLQLEIRRSINKFDLYLSPNYRGNLKPIFPEEPIRNYKSFGVRFGVAYQF
ncbi:hypothetical protein [Brumimicrobium mesophilum]|uniref:hypothetical protein n=1 Tax=Brumimicrobium mesophilum TaxID=392717 RepID=UPI000D13EBEA|nr:hypothetical protein [Brumimicrobium mesophilum]